MARAALNFERASALTRAAASDDDGATGDAYVYGSPAVLEIVALQR